MNNALKTAGGVLVGVIGYFAVKTLLLPAADPGGVTSPEFDQAFMEEVSENGINADAGRQILDATKAMVEDEQRVASLEDAYRDVNGKTTKEVRLHLNANPEQKARVGYALVETIQQGMALPVQLDEVTAITGLHYSEAAESVVYHYTISDAALAQFNGDYTDLQLALEQLNPDATCKLSLQLLGQGFDMTYSYRNSDGEELFTVVRTHEDCVRMGYNEFA